jgi:acetoacetyl-CoA synthetase
VLIFAADGYRFAGRDFDRGAELRAITAGLPSLRHVVWLPYLDEHAALPDLPGAVLWADAMAHADVPAEDFSYTRVPSDHPLWILFSSGTTGLPKAIVHGHMGALIEHQKLMHLHFDFGPASVMLFYTTTGWMMWNLLLSALLTGAAVVLYDGSPTTPGPDFLWRLAAQTGATSFGASPTFVQIMERAGLRPGALFDLRHLTQVVVAGAPCTPEIFAWFYDAVKPDLWVTSQSGGTEIASGFVGAAPGLAVHAGEIQTRMLGMDVAAWGDDGTPVTDAVGELVLTAPCPSMPIFFWNDPDGRRYHEAYFDVFPGIWRHGDFIKINARGGCYIYGRSDSTLNRHGVRIGTAEIYRTVERMEGVADSLVVCCELPGGGFFMPLFLRLAPGAVLDAEMERRIAAALRQDCSPRHVPDRMYAIDAVPTTLTGKKMEVPVRKLLMGWSLDRACSRDAMMNPEAIEFFVNFARESKDYDWRPQNAARRMGEHAA